MSFPKISTGTIVWLLLVYYIIASFIAVENFSPPSDIFMPGILICGIIYGIAWFIALALFFAAWVGWPILIVIIPVFLLLYPFYLYHKKCKSTESK